MKIFHDSMPSKKTFLWNLRFASNLAMSLFITATILPLSVVSADDRPNIMIIMADDMGYSDIGCYGGEIQTPNLDALAQEGLRFTQFYNTARCCPTRASLLTGLHPHQTGIGHMTVDPEKKGNTNSQLEAYQGFLNHQCVTIPEVLKPAGYHCMMAGKWHVGLNDLSMYPLGRGFEKYYGILSGATNYMKPLENRGVTFMNDPIQVGGDDYYLTDDFTTHAIEFLNDAHQSHGDQPFFFYMAYTSPHWPLQAPADVVEKYRGKYMHGWDALRRQRYERMIKIGLIDQSWKLTDADSTPWNELDQEKQQEMDYRMAIYAAQIDRMDQNIGRLIETLKANGEFENTVIFFLSDNGGCAEGGEFGSQKLEDLNHPDTPYFTSYGRAWANASNTPFREYKHFTHEGGISTPLIIHAPGRIPETGGYYRQPGYLPDLMATCVDLANATYPETFAGEKILPMEGTSLVPAFTGNDLPRSAMYWEHEENRAVREGPWKLVSKGPKTWELYNIDEDRTETQNLLDQHKSLADEMADHWYGWARRVGAIPNGKNLK